MYETWCALLLIPLVCWSSQKHVKDEYTNFTFLAIFLASFDFLLVIIPVLFSIGLLKKSFLGKISWSLVTTRALLRLQWTVILYSSLCFLYHFCEVDCPAKTLFFAWFFTKAHAKCFYNEIGRLMVWNFLPVKKTAFLYLLHRRPIQLFILRLQHLKTLQSSSLLSLINLDLGIALIYGWGNYYIG